MVEMTTITPEDTESKRQRTLAGYDILDWEAERSFDELARLAATVCQTPMAIISFIAADRQWFKATVGLDLTETPRNIAFCDHTVAQGQTLVVPDARLDSSFSTNPLVQGSPGIRFYAGSPLQAADGSFIGTVAVLDVQPRALSADQRSALELIARLAMDQVEKRARTLTLEANLAIESKLRESQHMLEIAGRVARLGGWRVDLEPEQGFWSDQVAMIHGEDPGFQPASLADAINYLAPEHRERMKKHFSVCAEQGVPFDEQIEIITAQGKRVWVRTTGEPVRDHSGRIIAAQGALQDISERRTAEEELIESAERMRGILETASDAILTINEAGVIESANPVVEKVFGYRSEELLGESIGILMPESHRRQHRNYVQRYMETGQARILGRTVEINARHKAGHDIPIALSVSETRLAKRRIFTGFIRDISQQERARLALAASEERFRKVAQVTSDVIWDLDLVARKVWWSEGLEATFGVPASEVHGDLDWWAERIHPNDRDQVVASLDATLAGGQTGWTSEYRFRKHDDSYAFVRDTGLVIRDEAGQAIRMVGGLRDLTQEYALKEQIARSQRLESIGQLTGGIAHDFNNLLTVILGNSELLGELLEGDDKTIHLAQMIQSAAQRGAELTCRLLAFARRQDLDPEPTDIRRLVNDMRPLLRRSVPANVTVRMTHASDLWLADIDPGQLESALLNLVLNARDAMPDGGALLIETANFELGESFADAFFEISAGQYVQISVTDNGQGIEQKYMGRLFEPFFTTKAKDRGTGLGLPMVYGFIKQSRGHIQVYSEPGEGTTVRMYLPRSGAARAVAATAFEPDLLLLGNERILVVEDDELVLQHVQRVLQMLGYQVESARNADHALTWLEDHDRFDLLFTDVIMPGALKGPDLAIEARRLQPGLRVLFTSGYTENAVLERGQLDTTVHLLQKPYRRRDLARKIREALDSDF